MPSGFKRQPTTTTETLDEKWHKVMVKVPASCEKSKENPMESGTLNTELKLRLKSKDKEHKGNHTSYLMDLRLEKEFTSKLSA